MERGRVVARLKEHEEELRRAGVMSLYLFGSTARDEGRADSDVDLFFDHDDPRFSLIELVRLQRQVARILGVEADVMTRDSLHPMLKRRIEASATRVF
jgi:uncharacterized protein